MRPITVHSHCVFISKAASSKKSYCYRTTTFSFLGSGTGCTEEKKEKKPKHFFHCTRRGQRLGQKCLWWWMLNFHTYCSVLVPDLSRKVFRNIRFIKFDSTSLPVNYVLKRNIVHVLGFLFLFLVNH